MYVYILKSLNTSEKYYVGITENIKQRLHEHNDGKSAHTSKYRPWKFKNVFWFENSKSAYAFEKYLKSGSGRAFAKRHFG